MGKMRMRRNETCIVPDCEEAEFSGAKPIYIQLTLEGKRTWKKVGALCRRHLPLLGLDSETDDWLPSAVEKSKRIMSWLVSCPADDINFKTNLQKASLPLLRRTLERLEDELKRGFPHKTRIKKVTARIRVLEKESVVDQVLPRKKVV